MIFKLLNIETTCFRLFVFALSILANSSLRGQFFENKGQLDSKILYYKAIHSGNMLISDEGFSYLFYDDQKFHDLYEKSHHAGTQAKFKLQKQYSENRIHFHSIRQTFIGAEIDESKIENYEKLPTAYHYFLGNKPENWATDVHSYHKLLIRELYPGIDLELISNGLDFKYNFVCKAGSNPALIKVKYEGAESLSLINNSLKIKTSLNEYIETVPVSYLLSKSGQTESVAVEMRLNENILEFVNIPEKFHNSGYELVIDPKLVFSTYSGTTADNFGFTATYDDQGNLYAGGITSWATTIPNGRYPATPGAFSTTFNGGLEDIYSNYGFPCDITISKYSSDGKQLIYATYIGGANNEYPHSLVVDNAGNLLILGSTFSLNYPTTSNAYSNFNQGKADIVLTKLSANGDALIGSTYYGGTANDGLNESNNTNYFYADNFRGDIITDASGAMYGVISTGSTDIEIKNGFKKTNPTKVQQGLIFKFSPDASQLYWSSYVGSDFNSSIYSIDFDKSGNIFVSGGTAGAGLMNTSGSVGPNYKGGRADGYIAKIASDGRSLIKATYFGSDRYDQVISLELDDQDRVYVVGQTDGTVPIVGQVYNTGNTGQFVSVLKNDLSSIIYSATFGGGTPTPDITINAFMVAECNRVFISGWGGKTTTDRVPSSTTKNLPVTPDATQKSTDGSDFYIIVFSKELKKLLYATYFGGNQTGDHVDGGTSRFDKKGVVYQSVCSSCPMGNQVGPISDFPTTPGAFAEKNISPRCSNAAFKFALENLNLKPVLRDTFFELTAFDTLNFNYAVSDPDEDTINTVFSSMQNIEADFFQFPKKAYGVGKSVSNFSWSPKCKHVTKDTFVIKAEVKDRGCPDFKTNSAKIKILVHPPPVINPPETVCLIFTKNNHLQISWSAIPYSRYYAYTVFYKVFPNGATVVIDTIKNIGEGLFIDNNVTDPRKQNYGYYLKVVNICGSAGPDSYRVNSVQEDEFPVIPTKIYTATVVDNKNVSVSWFKSLEPDFMSYSLYRSKNIPTLNYEYVKDLTDTFFMDETVNVQSESFCYSIVVNDQCGHISKKSNVGCNIVLTGESKPFYHVLDWQPYRLWEAGVSSYTLERSVDTGSLRPIASVIANKLNYDDHELDYDWGGYWYCIVGHESFKGHSATSRSNSIYLIQPPLLHVPNAFTKNNDLLNDTWGFVPVFVKTYHMQVYNRWGQKVFDSKDKHQDWDGNYLEETKGTEVFIWQVTYTGWDRSSHYQKGTVTVIK